MRWPCTAQVAWPYTAQAWRRRLAHSTAIAACVDELACTAAERPRQFCHASPPRLTRLTGGARRARQGWRTARRRACSASGSTSCGSSTSPRSPHRWRHHDLAIQSRAYIMIVNGCVSCHTLPVMTACGQGQCRRLWPGPLQKAVAKASAEGLWRAPQNMHPDHKVCWAKFVQPGEAHLQPGGHMLKP